MNRRTFLHLAAAAVAGTVAVALGGGRGVEPAEIAWDQTPTWTNDRIAEANNGPAHELLSSAHPDIVLDDESLITWPWVRVIADWREG